MSPLLRTDCARCAALCCVALSFDRSSGFPFDKPAGERCLHLDPSNRCSIYGQRAACGFGGCSTFDCLGAGNRVTQALQLDPGWHRDPRHARAALEAFALVREAHCLLELLLTAEALQLPSPLEEERAHWCARLSGPVTAPLLEEAAVIVPRFLRRLAEVLPARCRAKRRSTA